MPELPDVLVYVEAIADRVLGHALQSIQILSPFVLRSVEPGVEAFMGKQVLGISRIGKRIVLEFEDELFAVGHLMIAGRFHWLAPAAKLNRKRTLLAFSFAHGLLQVTEAGSKRRASLNLVRGRAALAEHDPGGRDLSALSSEEFAAVLRAHNHTLKRALTDPRLARDQLLSDLPNRGQTPGRSGAVAPAGQGLAEEPRSARELQGRSPRALSGRSSLL